MTRTALFGAAPAISRALDEIPQGIAIFDADLGLTFSNRRCAELLGASEALLQPGMRLHDLASFLAARGDLGAGDPAELAARRVETLTAADATISQRLGAGRQTLEFHASRQPDGDLVISIADVTARVEAEAELERVNASLERRV